MALGAVETETEGTEAVAVVVEVEVSGAGVKMGLASLSAWSFRACLGGSLWYDKGWAGPGMAPGSGLCCCLEWKSRVCLPFGLGPWDIYSTLLGT